MRPDRQVCITTHACGLQHIQGEEGTIEVVEADSEREMIMLFADRIAEEDPAFLTGFNDSSFDWPFLLGKL